MHRRTLLFGALPMMAIAAPGNELLDTLSQHLDLLIENGEVVKLDGKDADATTAIAYHRIANITGNAKFKKAALQLSERIVKAMRESAVGLLDIKEWGPDKIMYGAPPPLGWYGGYASLLLGGAGRIDDAQFIAGVLDRYPWYEKAGWWATSADVRNNKPLEPLDSPGIINKCCGMAFACGVASELVAKADPPLAARLRAKTQRCIENTIAAQHPDGYWNYKYAGTEPKSKDTVGYFMLTTNFMIRLRELAPSYRQPGFDKMLAKAGAFAMKEIAPMTSPNQGKAPSRPIGGKTPERYDPSEAPKRSYQLSSILAHGKYKAEASKILAHALPTFPKGNRGQFASQCVEPASMAAVLLA